LSIFGSLAESNGFSGDVLSDSRRIKEDTMSLTRCLILMGLIATLLISSGCGVKESMLDRNWGKSFELAKSNQIINGPDEQVTEANIGKYRGYAEK
jgi:fructose-1,6-bisphosphatase